MVRVRLFRRATKQKEGEKRNKFSCLAPTLSIAKVIVSMWKAIAKLVFFRRETFHLIHSLLEFVNKKITVS